MFLAIFLVIICLYFQDCNGKEGSDPPPRSFIFDLFLHTLHVAGVILFVVFFLDWGIDFPRKVHN